jgi:hypothetical protein
VQFTEEEHREHTARVDAAMAELEEKTKAKAAQKALRESVYGPQFPAHDEATARRLFGPGSDSRAANQLAIADIEEYHRVKHIAVALNLVAWSRQSYNG